MAHATSRKGSGKDTRPSKPRPTFPLFPHRNGSWSKKIKGKLHYFGSWRTDPNGEEAEKLWDACKEDLLAGREPSVAAKQGVTLENLCDEFLEAKELLLESGELAARTWQDYYRACERLIDFWGKERLIVDLSPSDFDKLRADTAKTRGAVGVGNMVRLTRIIFKFAFDVDLVDKPIKFGPHFKTPKKKTIRKERNGRSNRMFEADEIRKILDKAPEPLRTMTLLGINAGLGNTDLSEMRVSHVDLQRGWLVYPRVKTEIVRTCPLWQETLDAITPYLEGKKSDARLFLTVKGNPWVSVNRRGATNDSVAKEFGKLLDDLKITRNGRGFYGLRRSFETIGGESKDQPAVDHIMGHDDGSMAAIYRQRISDERLQAVVDTVHGWLFPKEPDKDDQAEAEDD